MLGFASFLLEMDHGPNGTYLRAFGSPVRRMGASKGNRKQCLPGAGRGPSFAQVTAQFKLGPGLRRGDR